MLLPTAGHCQICIDEDLRKLDLAVEQRGKYEQAKQKEIDHHKLAEGNCITTMDRYSFHESLYRLYLKWNPDSAVAHARRCQEIASANNLHYSTQTIYNYRLKMRHASCIPEKDFAETVASMYS